MKGHGDFSIGSEIWPGISKLNEEMGEVLQVTGKLQGSSGERMHWDGSDLKLRLEEELGDLLAAAGFVGAHCDLDMVAIAARRKQKRALFEKWHRAGNPLSETPTPPAEVERQDADGISDTCQECILPLVEGRCPEHGGGE